MILYKYVSFEAALTILKTKSLGFSHLEDFNDPFEGTALGVIQSDIEGISSDRFIQQCKDKFSRRFGVLSLTRAPLNPLMWSHYADSYNGVVIGIDTQKAGLEDIEKFMIPAQRGEIIYLATAPKNPIELTQYEIQQIAEAIDIDKRKYEDLCKRAFLYKSLYWAYEEEVRVVKNIYPAKFSYHSPYSREKIVDGQIWKRISLGTRPIYTIEVPQDAFVELYIGKNVYVDQRRKYQMSGEKVEDHIIPKFEELRKICSDNNINFYRVDVDIEQWKLKSSLINKVT